MRRATKLYLWRWTWTLCAAMAIAGNARAQVTITSDRAALEALYDATGGANWTTDTNWKTTAPIEDWYGITTDAEGRVTELRLSDNGLTGSIPTRLGDLDRLQWLDLSSNELTGPISGALEQLANLVILDLSWNDLTGPVPNWLGNMPNLFVLYLLGNKLTGGIPDELGNRDLWGLGLSWNELSVGPIPAWLTTGTNLRWLDLSGSGVTGRLPATLGNQTNLEHVHLSYNWGLSGALPTDPEQPQLEALNIFVTQACAPTSLRDRLGTIDFNGRLCESTTDVEIDVAVVYTAAARAAAGGVSAIEAEIDLMVAETNQAYETSRVNHRVALAGRAEVAYSETRSGDLDLDRLLDPSDGQLDDVHDLRDRTGADLVHMIVSETENICGIAVRPGVFSLSLHGCGGLTFAHELGHNMGLLHDRYQEFHRADRALRDHPAYGYVNPRGLEPGAASDRRWFTIMAYPTQCNDAGVSCGILPSFSTPRLETTTAGDPLGVRYGGGRSVTGAADAVAVLNATGPAVARWRDRVDRPTNRAPMVVATLLDLTLAPGGVLDVDVAVPFVDPDGDTLSYNVSPSPRDVVTIASTGGTTVRITATGVGTATIEVTATDPGGLTATTSFRVTVTRGNQGPEAVGTLPPLTLEADDRSVTVDVTGAFRDPDGDGLTYGASSSRPGVAAVSVSGSRLTVTPRGPGATTVTVTATDTGGGSNQTATQTFTVTVVQPFTDDPIVPGETPVRAVHFTELRSRIDGLRTGLGLAPFTWTDPNLRPGVTRVRLVHLTELRSALADVYRAAGRPAPRWTDTTPVGGTTPIRATHLTELRAAIVALE